jgi:hypothetical protein
MDFLEQNLAAIRRHRPGLFSSLQLGLAQSAPEGDFRLIECGNGRTDLEVSDRSGRVLLLCRGNPDEVTRRSLELSAMDSPSLVVADGFGLGYHFLEFERSKPDGVRDLLVVEKSPWIFSQALRLHDLTRVFASKNIEFLVGVSPDAFYDAATDWLTRHARVIFASRIGHLYFEPALASDGSYYLAFAEALRSAVDGVHRAFAAPGEDNFRALMNIVRNRRRIEVAPAFSVLSGSCAGLPAILVGSGPSLDAETESLARYRDRAVILAADAAVKPLLKRGIRPHLVITTERVAVTKHLLDGLPDDFKVPLLALPSTHPETLEAYPGPVVLLRRAATFGAWLWPETPDLGLPLGVTPAGCHVLRHLGCSEIAFLGQDLSWPDDKPDGYADGTAGIAVGSAKDLMGQVRCTVEGNSGRDIATTLGWKNSLEELNRLIPALGIPCRHVIAADRGAKISTGLRVDPGAFWREVSERPSVPDAGVRISLALTQASLVSAPLADLFRRTAEELESFIGGLLEMLQTMSSEYHDKVNAGDAASFRPEFNATLERWRGLEDGLIGRHAELFYFFVNMMSGGAYVTHLSAREADPPSLENPVFSLFRYLVKTVEWGNDAAAWAGRALHLLRRAV